MTGPITAIIDAAVRCTKCGKPPGCDCWPECVCHWSWAYPLPDRGCKAKRHLSEEEHGREWAEDIWRVTDVEAHALEWRGVAIFDRRRIKRWRAAAAKWDELQRADEAQEAKR